jgi:hypothetical protein
MQLRECELNDEGDYASISNDNMVESAIGAQQSQELLEIETGGYLRASPHRVINERIDRQRYSVPVFINPALDAPILPGANSSDCVPAAHGEAHVHKVIRPGTTLASFVFGDSEFERKANGVWCYEPECVSAL